MLREFLIGLAGLVILAIVLDLIFARLDDPREPPRVSPGVPLIGHLIGFLYNGFEYYNILSRRTNAEVYTIGLLHFKVYISQTTRLHNAIQRARTLSTKPFLRNENKIHATVTEEAHALFDGQVLEAFSLRTKNALAPGPSLDNIGLCAAEEAARQVSLLLKQDRFDMLVWTRHVAVQITSRAMFGEHHPFRNAEIVDAMWTWEDYRPTHQIGLDVWQVGHRARAKVFSAFREYLQRLPDDVSFLIRERQDVLYQSGMDEEDIVKMQAHFSDTYSNIWSTMFWTLYEVFSRPHVLEDIRDEIFSKAVIRTSPSPMAQDLGSDENEDKGTLTLDISAVKTECAVLLSTFQETQRHRHEMPVPRMVTEDTLLDGLYLLKRGNWLQMPAQPVHSSRNIWGPDADVFDPYRFVSDDVDTKNPQKKIQRNSFHAWGTAPYTCPGRQFVATEIMAVTALLAMQFDLIPEGRDGPDWERNPATRPFQRTTLARPKKGVPVKLVSREGAGKWNVVMGRSTARVPLASG
ncbi:hypothetical protein G7054_g8363 [Neopestalotiopsis clavispora]|nr:hypothetical protein G7054_g8363 [Neopestalotiopsis clavispora]